MLFQRISRKGPERIFGIFYNAHGTAVLDGEVMVLNTGAIAQPGVEVLRSTSLSQNLVVGVVAGTIQATDYGTIQVYGLHPNVKTTVAALAAGTVVYSDASSSAAANVAAIARADMGTLLGVSIVLGAANRAQIFIKCMG